MKKNYIKEVPTSKQDWLNHRSIGGSSASALLGCNPYMTKLDIYCASVNEKEKQEEENDNETMAYGRACEPLIRQRFKVDFGDKYVVHNPQGYEMYRRIDKPFMSATLDGRLVERETGKKLILEIKTRRLRNRADEQEWNGQLPQRYYAQVIHYLAVMNDYDGAILVANLQYYDYFAEGGKKLLKTETRYYYIDRAEKQADIDALEKIETTFYEEHIAKRVPPNIHIDL